MSSRFESALIWAAQLHADQERKTTGAPYLEHLLGVASIALRYGASEDEAIAALLHDAVEDQGGDATRREIETRFGAGVAAIVDGCTDTDETPKPPWRERKEAYIAHAASASASAVLVSASDKLHNATAILADCHRLGDEIWSFFKGGRDGSLWYYRALVDAYRQAQPPARVLELVDELERVVTAIEAFVSARES